MNKLLLASAMLLTFATTAMAAEVSGVKLDDQVNVDGKQLVLNGAGLRTKFGLADVYVAGLYLPKKTRDAAAIIGDKEPRRITMVMQRSVDSATMLKAFHEGIEKNLSASEQQALKPKLDQLDASFNQQKQVKEGDIINLDFGADGSLHASFNGQQRDVIAGPDIASALLKIWIGGKPAQDDLKIAMLKG